MIRHKSLGFVLLLGLGVFLTASASAQPPPQAPKASKPAQPPRMEAGPAAALVLEPRAIDLLKAASARLAAARTMSFTAVVSYESPSLLGPPLVYMTRSEVTLQRPDRLRVITAGDGPASEFYYDGKTMMAFAPAENLVAVAEAPATIDAALKAAYDAAGIYFPFTDVIVADPYRDIADGLKVAFYIGQSRVLGGTTTDMVAYASDQVLVQSWIGAEDKLPRMLRAVFRGDALRLRHQLELSNWQLDPAVAADAFASSSAGTAMRIPFTNPNPKPPPGAKSPASAKPPAKSQTPAP